MSAVALAALLADHARFDAAGPAALLLRVGVGALGSVLGTFRVPPARAAAREEDGAHLDGAAPMRPRRISRRVRQEAARRVAAAGGLVPDELHLRRLLLLGMRMLMLVVVTIDLVLRL